MRANQPAGRNMKTPLQDKPADAKPPTAPRYSLTLQALPDNGGPPAIIRLRRFLKMALRSYGLKCTSVLPANPGIINPPCPMPPDASGKSVAARENEHD